MARAPLNPWRETVRLADLARGPVRRRLEPDAAQRVTLAKTLGLDALESLSADVVVSPWLDGAEISGRFTAQVVQTCGVTLDPFEQTLAGEVFVRVLPAGSPNAPVVDSEEIDLEADDPPDLLDGEEIDLAAYVTEHVALEVDPFPRKPGAVFEPPVAEEETSPFAVLKGLKRDDPPQ